MSKTKWISLVFIGAAAYDGLLGLIFIVMPLTVFQMFDITLPNHFGYVHFPAGLLMVFAVMFAHIATNPQANRNLIPYGILLKITYCTVVFIHWFASGIPSMWKWFAGFDLIWLILFVAIYRRLRKS